MTIKRSFLPLAAVFIIFHVQIALASSSVAQAHQLPELKQGWTRVHIENVGNIDLPPTMEVQGGKYKEFVDNLLGSRELTVPQLAAQQKGLNENKGPTGKYARVMVETDIGSYGDYETLDYDINGFTKADIAELNTATKQQVQQSFIEGSKLGVGQVRLVEWHPVSLKKINGMSCYHLSYTRQMNANPSVIVDTYIFQNNDRLHRLIMSYRVSEAEYWEKDFATILKSFRITNVR